MMRILGVLVVFLVMGAVLLVVKYRQLDEGKKRFVRHLLKQAKYLPGRYFS